VVYQPPGAITASPFFVLTNQDLDPNDLDFRSLDQATDTDGDGIADRDDLDDDNDGVLDVDEGIEVVTFTSANVDTAAGSTIFTGATPSGIQVTTTFSVEAEQQIPLLGSNVRIDNDNFAIQTGDTAPESQVRFDGNDVISGLETQSETIDIDFVGGDVSEVLFHFNSLDQFNLAFNPANNPGISFQILSLVEGQNIGNKTLTRVLEIQQEVKKLKMVQVVDLLMERFVSFQPMARLFQTFN